VAWFPTFHLVSRKSFGRGQLVRDIAADAIKSHTLIPANNQCRGEYLCVPLIFVTSLKIIDKPIKDKTEVTLGRIKKAFVAASDGSWILAG
jgi:hypothetical protein